MRRAQLSTLMPRAFATSIKLTEPSFPTCWLLHRQIKLCRSWAGSIWSWSSPTRAASKVRANSATLTHSLSFWLAGGPFQGVLLHEMRLCCFKVEELVASFIMLTVERFLLPGPQPAADDVAGFARISVTGLCRNRECFHFQYGISMLRLCKLNHTQKSSLL